MRDRPGCLSGLMKLAFLNWLFDWLQDRFGFGRGLSCTGIGCGLLLLLLILCFVILCVTGIILGLYFGPSTEGA